MKVGYISCNYKAGNTWRENTPIEINMDSECAVILQKALIDAAKSAMDDDDYSKALELLKGIQDIIEVLDELYDAIRDADLKEE